MRSLEPTSRTVVKPASTTARALTAALMACSATSRRNSLTNAWFQSSLYSPVRWVWASMNPGKSVASPRSITAAPAGIVQPRPGRDDLRALDQDDAVAHQLVRLAVEEPRGLEGRDARLFLLGPEFAGKAGNCQRHEQGDRPPDLHREPLVLQDVLSQGPSRRGPFWCVADPLPRRHPHPASGPTPQAGLPRSQAGEGFNRPSPAGRRCRSGG